MCDCFVRGIIIPKEKIYTELRDLIYSSSTIVGYCEAVFLGEETKTLESVLNGYVVNLQPKILWSGSIGAGKIV